MLFFSSLLKILISDISVSMNFLSTAFPNEPVPPVISKVLPLKELNLFMLNFYNLSKCTRQYFYLLTKLNMINARLYIQMFL